MMPLSALIPGVIDTTPIESITLDSRQVRAGSLFLAIAGHERDGRGYVEDALGRGASAVAYETPWADPPDTIVPLVAVANLREVAGDIAARFHGHPSAALTVVGVTGTNGKTSCSHYIAAALTAAGERCGVIGTLGAGFPPALDELGMTTPDPLTMQAEFARLLEDGATAVALEASSHGLAQGRLNGTVIDVAVFTNLTRDHLDYHADESAYRAAKRRLLAWPGLRAAIVNIADPVGRELAAGLAADRQVITCGAPDADVHATGVTLTTTGFTASFHTPWGDVPVRSSLIGAFNVDNLLAVTAVLGVLNRARADWPAILAAVSNVRGRMDVLAVPDQATVVIDYAHTPDALQNALLALRPHVTGGLYCVFGCGGDRDAGKRSLMGAIAGQYADVVVVTSDNPRGEDPAVIAADVVRGIGAGVEVVVETDRARAIAATLDRAGPDDVVLVAGKGHETYQDIGGERLPFSDHDVVAAARAST